ncbi:hypothetical protein G6F68_020798 [Rhizopus microsporus]|nr:hypothetical protein G6F68_020798 [Rhizopus microsporus]
MPWLSKLTSSVLPSGSARATKAVAIWLAAPGRFSTTTARPPNCCDRRGCRMRARMSELPPGGYGTTRISGRSSAAAGAAIMAPPAAAVAHSAASTRFIV